MNGENHQLDEFSTYSFYIFGNDWEKTAPRPEQVPYKGDTVIGNDVWIGYESVIMPGVQVGHGAIIASKSVVVNNIVPYTIVDRNPAKLIHTRFDDEIIQSLLEIAWWD